MNRRKFLMNVLTAAITANVSGCKWWPSEGLSNPCLPGKLPPDLANHDIVLSAWEGIDSSKVWDCHSHLIGVGDSNSGIYVNPNMLSFLHPVQHAQFKFYVNATCATSEKYSQLSIDQGVIARMQDLLTGMSPGVKLMLLAFDYYHDEHGQAVPEYSAFYTPNHYAQKVAQQFPQQFEWIASIHPYRENSVSLLEKAKNNGARAVKWLPGAMGIDPASPRCDTFYQALVKYDLPLLVHTGSERAVETPGGQDLGNPLLLRRALKHKVRVILAHCATTGQSIDIDKGKSATLIDNFLLFHRLMDNPEYALYLYADISAITQANRAQGIVSKLIQNQAWHSRLLFGSDYPLPGVFPLFSTQKFVDNGGLSAETAKVLIDIRRHNVILYDFLLKRHFTICGKTVFNQRI